MSNVLVSYIKKFLETAHWPHCKYYFLHIMLQPFQTTQVVIESRFWDEMNIYFQCYIFIINIGQDHLLVFLKTIWPKCSASYFFSSRTNFYLNVWNFRQIERCALSRRRLAIASYSISSFFPCSTWNSNQLSCQPQYIYHR